MRLQLFLFEKASHPQFIWFEQCVPINMAIRDVQRKHFFGTLTLANTVLNGLMVYILPLIIVTVSQTIIISRIRQNAQGTPAYAPRHTAVGSAAAAGLLYTTGVSFA